MSQSNQQQVIKTPSKTRFTAIFIVLAALYIYSWIGVEAEDIPSVDRRSAKHCAHALSALPTGLGLF